MNKIALLVVVLLSSTVAQAVPRLLGIGNRFIQQIGEKKAVSISVLDKNGNVIKDEFEIVPKETGFVRIGDFGAALPLQIKVRYSELKGGKEYTIDLKTSDRSELTAQNKKTILCEGNSKVVRATVDNRESSETAICVPDVQSIMPYQDSGLYGEEFNNFVLLVGPKQPLDKQKEYEFSYAITPWVSLEGFWNSPIPGKRGIYVSGTPDEKDKFKDRPLQVYQAYAAIGGGKEVPLNAHAIILHAFNATRFVIEGIRIVDPSNAGESRGYFRMIMPPYSAFPYLLAYIPNIKSSLIDDIEHAGITLSAILKPIMLPDVGGGKYNPLTQTRVDTLPSNEEAYTELKNLALSKLSDVGAQLLGITPWANLFDVPFGRAYALNYQYVLSTKVPDKVIVPQMMRLEKGSVKSLAETLPTLNNAYTAGGIVKYYNLIITEEADEKEPSKKKMMIQLVPTKIQTNR